MQGAARIAFLIFWQSKCRECALEGCVALQGGEVANAGFVFIAEKRGSLIWQGVRTVA